MKCTLQTQFDPMRDARMPACAANPPPLETAAVPHAIRIHTLGRFSVEIAGRPLPSSGKTKQRPLALLKALIALGGRCVTVGRLCECLWPDAEGDQGMRNLTITVHRLRQMLGVSTAILLNDGKLTLNDKICSVDAWEFERLANAGLEHGGQPAAGACPEARLRLALRLYSGHFLSREIEEPWMVAARLRLKTKFERVTAALTEHLEYQRRHAEAVDACLQALGLDPLNEFLYRRLMSYYLRRGEIAAVMGIYRRCCEALAKGYGVPVSAETERLYLEALRASHQLNPLDARPPVALASRLVPPRSQAVS
ncbi:MAG TPA: BTAD domain-containing putative transcriptional regulator [Burkholderiales bacterium]|nr:BTAD domain-containing putative transcriptional regulator [Burkholderiales bacterium]